MIPRPRRCASAQPGPPRPGRWGLPQNPCSGRNFWRPGDGSFATGWGSFRPRRPAPAPDRLPAEESTSGPEVEDPIRGRESLEGVRHGTRLIGLKNLKARLQNRKAWSSTFESTYSMTISLPVAATVRIDLSVALIASRVR
jgi:hypothetical protein